MGTIINIKARVAMQIVSIDEGQYHSMNDHISASGLKLMRKSPLHFKYNRDNQTNEDKPEFRIGTAVHTLLLEPHLESEIIIVDQKSVASKSYKEARKENSGLVLLQKEMDLAKNLAKGANEDPAIRAFLTGGKAEQTFTGEYDGVKCKARMDYIKPLKSDNGVALVDLKTTAEISEYIGRQAILKYGYHIQAAWYLLMAELGGIEATRFIFIFLEKKEPFQTAIIELSPEFLEAGKMEMTRLFDEYKECMKTDLWPGIFENGRINVLDLPPGKY